MTDRPVYEFGDVRVDLGRMAATRAGAAITLEPKAFDVLVHLLEHHDRLVTKDELLETVWAGTFVTPNVLTRAVAQIRKALGDDVEGARYIETVAKRGYRFIAPVTIAGAAVAAPPMAVPAPRPAAAPERVAGARSHTRTLITAIVLVALVASIATVLVLVRQRGIGPRSSGSDIQLKRLTNRRGFSGTPALSPDGGALVYASDASGAIELYLASLTSGVAEVQLTRDGGHNMQPAWSPDGQWIAYYSQKRGGVWIIPANGGTPQQLTEFGSDPAWSPDSRTLVFTSDAGGLAGQSNLWTVDRDGSNRKPLTKIGAPAGGHRAPAWSHDGRFVAFVVSRGGWLMEVWIANVATGEQQLIDSTTIGATTLGADPAFEPGDRAILWSGATITGNGRLFRRALDRDGRPTGATEIVFPFEGSVIDGVSIASNGTLVFAARTVDANLWAVDIAPDGRVSDPVRVTDDVARSTHPDYAADGRIAYQQVAVGSNPSVWMINDDGTGKAALLPGTDAVEPQWDLARGRMLIARVDSDQRHELAWVDLASRRISPVGLSAREMLNLRLSPDARSLAFHSIEKDGRLNVWTTTLDGNRTQVGTDAEAVSYPSWSPNGEWLAVELKRGDATQIGVIPSRGGPVVQLTDARGQSWPHAWAPDNERIVFAGQRDGVWNIFTVSRLTRAVTQITNFQSATGYVRYPIWSPRGSRVVFERSLETANVWTARLPASPQ